MADTTDGDSRVSARLQRPAQMASKIIAGADRVMQQARSGATGARQRSGDPAERAVTIITVKLDYLVQNRWQPRREMDPDDIRALADSIKTVTLLQKPLVRPGKEPDSPHEIAFGHQRVEALKLLHAEEGWPDSADVELRELTDLEMAEIAFSENRHRNDVNPLDELVAWNAALRDIDALSVSRLAETAQVARTTIQSLLPLLQLPDAVLKHIATGECSLRAAREFLHLMNHDHTHEDVIEHVVNECLDADFAADHSNGQTRPTRRADFRIHRVRRFIIDTIRNDGDISKSWRSLDPEEWSHYPKPSFDVEAFRKERPEHIHRIPKATGSTGTLWTCDAKEWRKRQSAATREINSTPAAKKQRADAKPEVSAWLSDVRRDPVVVGVLGKAKARQLGNNEPERRLGAAMDEDTREALGERIRHGGGIKLPAEAYPEGMAGDRSLYDAEDPQPGFDYEECRTCPKAGWTSPPWGAPQLVCKDKKRYDNKRAIGIEAWKQAFTKARRDADTDDLNAYETVKATLSNGNPTAVDILVQGLWPAVRGLQRVEAFRHYPGSRFWPAGAVSLAKLLEVELPNVNGMAYNSVDTFQAEASEKIDAADPATRLEATALMAVWASRMGRGLDVPVVARATPKDEEPKTG